MLVEFEERKPGGAISFITELDNIPRKDEDVFIGDVHYVVHDLTWVITPGKPKVFIKLRKP